MINIASRGGRTDLPLRQSNHPDRSHLLRASHAQRI